MSEMQIVRDIAKYSETDAPTHRWAMVVDDETVSELWVSIETGEIMQVETPKAHRRNGYAAALYAQAATEIAIFHAPASHRTYEGNCFANAVGGDSLTCTYGCCTDDEDED